MERIDRATFYEICPVVDEFPTSEVCPICHDEISKEQVIRRPPKCRHLFHSKCLEEWITAYKPICPMCQTVIEAPKQLIITHEKFVRPNGYVYGGVTNWAPRRQITGSERIAMTTIPWHKGVIYAKLITVKQCEHHKSDIVRLECFKEDGDVHIHERCYNCFPSWKQHYMF